MDHLFLDAVENSVDECTGVFRSKAFPEIDSFIQGNFGGDIFMKEEFKDSHPKDIVIDDRDPIKAPVF